MRFFEFRALKEAESTIAVVGDSIAVGIGSKIKGAEVKAVVGAQSSKIVNFANDPSVQGAELAIISAGSNDIVKGKGNPQQLASNLQAIKSALKAKSYVWILPYDEVAAKVVQQVAGSDQTIPLTGYPTSDGLHPSNYGPIAQAAQGTTQAKPSKGSAPQPAKDQSGKAGPFVIDVPTGPRGTEVADVQKALMALGYDLPQHGVDGIRGPETKAAVSAFQQDNKLEVDGDPGPETVAALNTILKNKPEISTKLVKSTPADVKSGGVGQDLTKLPPLSTDAATKGKVGEVLNLIARYESRGDYNIILGGKRVPLTTMTINQVFDLQRDMLNSGKESSAVGRYQYIGSTLREMVKGLGLSGDTLFDEKTQDQIAIADLRRRCELDGWLAGKVSNEDFLYKMSKVWASLPNPQTGGSFYAGVGSNKSGIKTDVALNTLQDINTASA